MAYKVDHTRVNVEIPLSGTTTASAEIAPGTDGWGALIYFATPGFCANVSGDFTVKNPTGGILYSSNADIMSSGRTGTITSLAVPILGGGVVSLTLNAIPGSATGTSATPSTASFDIYMTS